MLALIQSSLRIIQSCFQNGSSSFVVFVDNSSGSVVSENFLENMVSSNCPDPGNRLFQESPGSNCFTGITCEGTCEVLADQDECQSTQPTAAPSSNPSAPTTAPSSFPTNSPVVDGPTRPPTPTRSPSARPPTRRPSVSPPSINPPTLRPTCPGKGFPPKPEKVKLSSRTHVGYHQRRKPIETDSTTFREWLKHPYLINQQRGPRKENFPSNIVSPRYDFYAPPTCPPTPSRKPSWKNRPMPTAKGIAVAFAIEKRGKKRNKRSKAKKSKEHSRKSDRLLVYDQYIETR